jgi:hypothetical protein
MKKLYRTPRVVEHGRIDQVTFGATGPSPDAIIVGGTPQVDVNSPTCTNNVGSGYCYHF